MKLRLLDSLLEELIKGLRMLGHCDKYTKIWATLTDHVKEVYFLPFLTTLNKTVLSCGSHHLDFTIEGFHRFLLTVLHLWLYLVTLLRGIRRLLVTQETWISLSCLQLRMTILLSPFWTIPFLERLGLFLN